MRSSDILTLLQAGYTKAEIEAMDQPEAPAQAPEAPDQTPEAPAQTPEAPAQTQEAPAQTPADGYARLESLLNQLVGIQQTNNVNHVNMGSNYEAERSTTDILASVIAPKKEK